MVGGGHMLSQNFLGLEGGRGKGADGENHVNVHSQGVVGVEK
jgi:hypothetical protein